MRSRKICLFSRQRLSLLVLAIAISLSGGSALAQTSAFTYQGRLTDGGTPANGSYDLQFALWNSASGGLQIYSTQNLPAVQVSNGVFTVTLDFGAGAFPGTDRFLEISARQTGASAFTLLTPRQQITSTPYAVRSATATLADTATNATQLGNVGASQYVQTTDSRLTDSRSPTAGSSNYIQNTTNQQSSSNFNISGTGTATIVNATTQFNLNNSRILASPGGGNLFAGLGAGSANTTGTTNAFVGFNAGSANTTGSANAFFGPGAGVSNTTGGANAFFGVTAGASNTTGTSNAFFGGNAGFQNTTASSNAFFGALAGQGNTTGEGNAFFGARAGLSNTTASSNAFFGADVGSSNTTGFNNAFFGSSAGAANTTGSSNAFFGTLAGLSNTTGANNAFFGVDAGAHNTTGFDNTFVGALAGFANTTGTTNAFFGAGAGSSNTTGVSNAFFGKSAGVNNTTAGNNAFFGAIAGASNTTGSANSFFGTQAGQANTTGASNSFFGKNAGAANTIGGDNAFFGMLAGTSNTTGGSNTFVGSSAGRANTTGGSNTFFGSSAGFANTTSSNNAFFGSSAGVGNTTGGNNTFVGINAGDTNTTGGSNTIVGAFADVASGNLTNAGAIGFEALATQDNSLILGSINGVNGASADTFVGIGTSAPAAKLHVGGGAILLDNNQGFFLKSAAGAQKRVLLADTGNTLHIGSGGSLGFDQIRFDLGTPGTVLTMLSNGSVGLGTTGPDQLLSVNGNASKVGGGSWQVFSDERLKNLKGQFKAGLQTLRQLQPLRYEYKPNNALGLRGEGEYVGFSAQAVQRVLPEAVSRTASGYLQINNDPILWTMLNAIKEQQQEIEQLKQQLHRWRGGARGHGSHGLSKATARALRKQ